MLVLGNKLTLNSQPIYHFVNKYSIDFDGVDDVIVTDGADTVLQNTTYSMWVKSSQTGANNGVFGHGSGAKGSFHFNHGDKPLLELGGSSYRWWNDNPAQDDGKWHHWVVYLDTDITKSKLYCDGVLQSVDSTVSSGSPNAYTESLNIGGDKQSGGNYFEGKIDEFAVYDRELTQAEITRMYNTYYSPNRVANGNFAQIGNEEVSNGDFSEVGSELVTSWTNNDFSSFASSGSDITQMVSSGSGNNNYSALTITSGKTYKLQFTSSQAITCQIRTSTNTNLTSATVVLSSISLGSNEIYFTAPSNYAYIGFYAPNSFTDTQISGFTLKEVGQDWETYTSGTSTVTFEEGAVLNIDGSNSNVGVYQENVFTNGTSYKIVVNMKATASFDAEIIESQGAVTVSSIGEVSLTTSYQEFTFYYQGTGTNDLFIHRLFSASGSNQKIYIKSASIKEVGQHWTFGSSWSTNGTEAIFTTGSTSLLEAPIGLIGNRTYRVSCVVTGSGLNLYMGTNTAGISVPVGTYNANIVTASNTNGTIGFLNNGGSFSGTLDNIVVQELKSDATNLMLNAGAYQSANPLITSTNSMEFDGVDDTLQLGSFINLGVDDFSLSFWVNLDSANNVTFASKFEDNSNRVIFNTNGANQLSTQGRVGGAYAWNFTGTGTNVLLTPHLNKWTHIAYSIDRSSNLLIFINGVLKSTTSISSTSATNVDNTGNWSFGDADGYSYLNGKMTEVGAYNRALTSLEVASLYNQGMPTNLLVNRNDYQSGNPTVFNTKVVDFDGTDDYLIANSTLGSMTGSLSFWYKRLSSSSQFLMDVRGGGGTGYVFFSGVNLDASISSGTIYVNGVAGDVNMALNEWHHLVVTGITLNIIEYLSIGKRFNLEDFLDGQMSQVGLWNSTLTADEVSSLYNHGLPIDLTTNQAAYSSSSNLVGYWRMGSGTLDTYPVIFDQTNATLGSELINCGDFACADPNAAWTRGTGTTISSGVANITIASSGSSPLSQSGGIFVSGKTFKITFTISNYSSGSIAVSNVSPTTYRSANGTYTLYGIGAGGDFLFFSSGFVGSVSNISVKQVNGNPAIMTNQTSTDIENGSPYANLIQNTNFTDTSEWQKAGWDITNNQAVLTGTGAGNNLYIDAIVELNKTYNIVIDIEITAGGLTVMLGGGGDGYSTVGSITSTGTHTITGKNVSTTDDIFLLQSQSGSTPDSIKINSVTLAEVNTGLQGYWKMGDGTNDEYPVIYDQTNPTLSAEKVTNGDFATDSDWTKVQSTISNGEATITSPDGSYAGIYQNFLTVGKVYSYNIDVASVTNGVSIFSGSSLSRLITSSGNYQGNFVASNVRLEIKRNGSDIMSATISSVSVKEVQGNPATMTNMVEGNITNQYPLTKIRNYWRMGDGILDKFPCIQDQTSPNLAHIPTTNFITYSEDFSNAAWTKSASTISINAVTSPDGTQNADNLLDTTANNLHGLYQSYSATANDIITATIFVKKNNKQFMSFLTNNNGSSDRYAYFDLVNKTTHNLSTGITASIEAYNNDWLRLSVTSTSGGGNPYYWWNIALSNSTSVYTGDGTGSIYIWGAQLEVQSQATAYIKSDSIAAVRKATTTNLVPYSEDISQWTLVNGTITPNATVSPDGTQNADKVVFNNTGLDLKTTVTVVAGQRYTMSFYIKLENGTGLLGRFYDNSNGANIEYYDYTSQIQGTEWSKITRSVTAPSGCTEMQIWLLSSSSTLVTASFWGAQFEEQTQAETYAPTTGLPVTIDLFTENNYGTMTNMVAGDIVLDTPNNPA